MAELMNKNWLAVACAAHVRIGCQSGFMQVCHGKKAPLLRIQPGDSIIYYSPTEQFKAKDKLQSFTAIGVVKEGAPYGVAMGEGFYPYRRDVLWFKANETPIIDLLPVLDFSRQKKNWGYSLRFGLVQLSAHDKAIIAQAMNSSSYDDLDLV